MPLSKISGSSSDKAPVKLNRKVVTFFICIIISTGFWFLISLSQNYTSLLKFPVNYLNLPKNKVISNHLPDNIEIELEASGFHLLSYKFKNIQKPISIDAQLLKPLKGKIVSS